MVDQLTIHQYYYFHRVRQEWLPESQDVTHPADTIKLLVVACDAKQAKDAYSREQLRLTTFAPLERIRIVWFVIPGGGATVNFNDYLDEITELSPTTILLVSHFGCEHGASQRAFLQNKLVVKHNWPSVIVHTVELNYSK